jgi:hypothetical protein
MRGATAAITGHGFIQNIRRRHDELGAEGVGTSRVTVTFNELALTIWPT